MGYSVCEKTCDQCENWKQMRPRNLMTLLQNHRMDHQTVMIVMNEAERSVSKGLKQKKIVKLLLQRGFVITTYQAGRRYLRCVKYLAIHASDNSQEQLRRMETTTKIDIK